MELDQIYNFPVDAFSVSYSKRIYQLGKESYKSKDYHQALFYFRRISKYHFPFAVCYLAYMYNHALGVERDPILAYIYYRGYKSFVKPESLPSWFDKEFSELNEQVSSQWKNIERYEYGFFDDEFGNVKVVHLITNQNENVRFTSNAIVYTTNFSTCSEILPLVGIYKHIKRLNHLRKGDNLGRIYDGFSREYPLFKLSVVKSSVSKFTHTKEGEINVVKVPKGFDMNLVQTREYIIEFAKNIMFKEANAYLQNRVDYISKQVGLEYSSLEVTKNRTFLGYFFFDTKLMRLTYHLLKSDPEFIDSVIIHELCHALAVEHDKYFYSQIEKYSSRRMVEVDIKKIGYSSVYDI